MGRKRVSVAMATEPAPCDLNVYLNARELRDVIFTPVFSTLFLPFSFVEDALGDNVILSAPSSLSLDDLPEATLYSLPPPFPPSLSSLFLPRRFQRDDPTRQRFLRQTTLVHWPEARN